MVAWKQFAVFQPADVRNPQKPVVDPEWVLMWKVVGGRSILQARREAKGFEEPDLGNGLVETAV